jgi:photosystem II stability/assembly factor-like uncharacterized protein
MPSGRLLLIAALPCLLTATAYGQFTNLGLFAGDVRDITAYDNGGSTELLIATAGRHAVYRCGQSRWEPAADGPCSTVEVEVDRTAGHSGLVWLVVDGRLLIHKPGSPWDSSGWTLLKGITRTDTLCGHVSGMYIGGDGTVYRTTDGGQTLAPLATFANERIASIAVYNQTLFYVVGGKSLYRCQDDSNGFVASRVEIADSATTGAGVTSVAIDANDPRNSSGLNRFFITTTGRPASLYRSDDGGKTWTRMPDPPTSRRMTSVRFAGFRDKRRVFAGGGYSDNYGQTWTVIPETTVATLLGYVSGRATGPDLVEDPNTPNLVYFASDIGVGQWDMTMTKAGEIHNALGIEEVAVFDLARVASEPAADGIAWAATDHGLGKTMACPATAGGGEWLFPIRPKDDTMPLVRVALHPSDLDIVLAGDTTGTIYRTTNGGATAESWSAVFSTRDPTFVRRYASPEKAAITAIRILGSGSTIVYSATACRDGKFEGAVYRSLNNGTTWDDDFAAVSGSGLNMPANDLAFLDEMVWAGVGQSEDSRSDAKGIYVRLSITGAANWWKLPTGTELDKQAVLAIEGVQIGSLRMLYAATEQGVFRGRLDNAEGSTWSWKDISPDGKQRYARLAVDPDNPNRICAAHDGTIWSSSDGGGTWGAVPCTDITSHDQVLMLAHDNLLIGTGRGLFAASDETFDVAGRIRTLPIVHAPATQPSGAVVAGPQESPKKTPGLLPFEMPSFFGLGIVDTVGIWLPLLAWIAIMRHNRSK